MEYIILGIIIFMLIILTLTTIILEKHNFNNGYCPYCRKKLKLFGVDSQGSRGYNCDCGYCTWVSYGIVDKNFYNSKYKK